MSEADKDKSVYQGWKDGLLDFAIEKGVTRTVIITQVNIYECFKCLREEKKLNYFQALATTSQIMNVSEDTVKRAIADVS